MDDSDVPSLVRALARVKGAKGLRRRLLKPHSNNFLATVSHELRNPLYLILLLSRLLLRNLRDKERIARGLTAIDRAVQSRQREAIDSARLNGAVDLWPANVQSPVC